MARTSTIGGRTTGARYPKYLQIKRALSQQLLAGHFERDMPMPSEKSLAESNGVSVGTIRQALSALEEEGLVRREHGRGTFATNNVSAASGIKQATFAMIAPQIREGSYPSLFHGFQEAATALHHQMVICNSQGDPGKQADYILQLIDQSVGGIAIVPTPNPATPAHQLSILQKHQIPLVFCHRTVAGIDAPSVVFRGHDIGRLAGEKLAAKGHRRVVNFFNRWYPEVENRSLGLRDGLQRVGNATHEVDVLDVDFRQDNREGSWHVKDCIRESLKQLMAAKSVPTAIFCHSSDIAELVYLEAISLGIRIPDELSLLYFGGRWRPSGLAERIASVVVDERGIGQRAGELLSEMKSGKRSITNKEQFVFEVSYMDGETLGPAPN